MRCQSSARFCWATRYIMHENNLPIHLHDLKHSHEAMPSRIIIYVNYAVYPSISLYMKQSRTERSVLNHIH
jgi:hypothetical protein